MHDDAIAIIIVASAKLASVRIASSMARQTTGWRLVDEEAFAAGLAFAPFVGVGGSRAGDVFALSPSVGVSPGAFITIGAREDVRLTLRCQASVGYSLFGGAPIAGVISVEPTFSWMH